MFFEDLLMTAFHDSHIYSYIYRKRRRWETGTGDSLSSTARSGRKSETSLWGSDCPPSSRLLCYYFYFSQTFVFDSIIDTKYRLLISCICFTRFWFDRHSIPGAILPLSRPSSCIDSLPDYDLVHVNLSLTGDIPHPVERAFTSLVCIIIGPFQVYGRPYCYTDFEARAR